jgi:hypothetical protein
MADCWRHLACLHRPDGAPYLAEDFVKRVLTREPGRAARTVPERVYLCGHSGAGLPLEEAAASSLILPGAGVPADLWLFDCTYWSKVAGFVGFCDQWKRAGRLGGGRPSNARFVCIFRPRTQTEEVADALRIQIAKVVGADPMSLVVDHAGDNFDKDIRPALKGAGALFLRTDLSHDVIPKFFIPALLQTAAS